VGLSTPIGDYILATRHRAGARALAANALWLALLGGIVAALAIVALESVAHVLPEPLAAVPAWPLAVALAVAGFAFNAHQIQLALASGRALLGAFLSFGTYAIAAIGYVAILLAGGGLTAAVWMVVLAPYLTAVVASSARPRWAGAALAPPDPGLAGATVREGIRFYVGELAAILHLRLDVILLGILAPVATVGVYVVAYQTAEPILVLASAASATVLALGHDAEDADRTTAVARLIRETIVLGAILCLLALVLAPFLIPLVYGSAFAASVGPFLLLLPAVLMLAVGRIAVADLMRRNELEETVVVSVVALATNVVANLLLIPRFGAGGAATSSLLSYSTQAVLAIAFERRASGSPWRAFVPGRADVTTTIRAWTPGSLVRTFRSRPASATTATRARDRDLP
jgi:O-antigen/teichoic acid export membrane protein